MTQQEIRDLCQPLFWVPVFFYDLSYARPTSDYLFKDFGPWYHSRYPDRWRRKHDCDKFARRYVIECQDAHANTLTANPESDAEGLAVGEFCYVQSSGSLHAIVCAVTELPGLTFIEPQTCQPLTLTKAEVASCFRVSF